jgi:phosphatidylglycerophosphate synthase
MAGPDRRAASAGLAKVPALMLREIADIYRASKKKKDINLWTEWVCRPPAAVFVYFFKDTRITPNQVTILSALICVGAGAMFVTLPGHLWVVMAALVFELSFVFDCVDGQLARIRKTSSPLGHLFDFLMDEIKAMLLFGCVTVRLWRQTDDELFLLVGLAALFALASGISMTSFMRRPEYGAPPPTADGQPAVMQTRSGVIGTAVSALEHLARTVVHYPSYIWLCAALNRIDVYFWIYAGVNALYLARTSLVLVIRLGRFEPRKETS